MEMILMAAESDNYVIWLSLILCSIGCLVILKGRNKRK